MRCISLKLSGFAGIAAGRKKNEVSLDLTPYEGTLVALTGPNGAGKSTIMDNLHPYRIMPSRAAGYSPNAFSYYENLVEGDAEKELIWEHNGTRYRTLLQFSNGKRKKTDAYLYAEDASGTWQPALSAGGDVVSDGKTDTYDRVLESILGSPETYFTSVFSAQNRKMFSSYSNGEIKGLMAELLGLEQLKEIGKNAGQVVSLLKPALQILKTQEVDAEALTEQRAALAAERDALQSSIPDCAARRTQAFQSVQAAQESLAQAKAAAQDAEKIAALRSTLSGELDGIMARIQRETSQVQSRKDQLIQEHVRSSQTLDLDLKKLEKAIQEANGELAAIQSLTSQRDAIRAAQKKESEVSQSIRLLQAELKDALDAEDAKRHHANLLQAELRESSGALAQLKSDGQGQDRAIQDLEQRSALIKEVPCAGTDLSGRCKLLASAHDAQAAIPSQKIRLEDLRAEYRRVQSIAAEKQKVLAGLECNDETRRTLQEAIGKLEAESRTLRETAAKAVLLDSAEQSIARWNGVIQDAGETIAAKQAQMRETEDRINAAIGELVQAEKQALAELEAEKNAKERQIAETPEVSLTGINDQQAALARAEADLRSVDAEHQRVQSELASRTAQIDAIADKTTDIRVLREKMAHLSTEITHWTLLSKAFGNDGVIALSIDDIGPTLSAYANDLLLACYGPRFTVSMRTQKETAKGDLKEGFDIVVFDADTQEGKSVEKMSGGERVWINEAITRAIALYLSAESGQQYKTLFTDEADGALDPDRKRMFMQMKREVLRIGGYEREYFISQTPELWEMADTVINVGQL